MDSILDALDLIASLSDLTEHPIDSTTLSDLGDISELPEVDDCDLLSMSGIDVDNGMDISFKGGCYSSSERNKALVELNDLLSGSHIDNSGFTSNPVSGGLSQLSTYELERRISDSVASGKLSQKELEAIYDQLHKASVWFDK